METVTSSTTCLILDEHGDLPSIKGKQPVIFTVANKGSVSFLEDNPKQANGIERESLASDDEDQELEDFRMLFRIIPRPLQKYAGMILTLIASLLFSTSVRLHSLFKNE